MSEELLQYGSRRNAQEILAVLDHIFQRNNEVVAPSRPSPVCIWGTHGLGKTQLVENYGKSHGWTFSYCAPAER